MNPYPLSPAFTAPKSMTVICRVRRAGVISLESVWPGWERMIAYALLTDADGNIDYRYDPDEAHYMADLLSEQIQAMRHDDTYASAQDFEYLLQYLKIIRTLPNQEEYAPSGFTGIEMFDMLQESALAKYGKDGLRIGPYALRSICAVLP
jgi:hypothetical protein